MEARGMVCSIIALSTYATDSAGHSSSIPCGGPPVCVGQDQGSFAPSPDTCQVAFASEPDTL